RSVKCRGTAVEEQVIIVHRAILLADSVTKCLRRRDSIDTFGVCVRCQEAEAVAGALGSAELERVIVRSPNGRLCQDAGENRLEGTAIFYVGPLDWPGMKAAWFRSNVFGRCIPVVPT